MKNNRRMTLANNNIVVEYTNERIIPAGGLAVVGAILGKSDFTKRLNRMDVTANRSQHQIKNGDIILTYIGMLCMGKPYFEAVHEMDDDKAFYQAALGITRSIPSEETLRQRMDDIGDSLRSLILDENIRMLLANKIQPGVLSNGFVPVDIDVTPMDNSKSGKEGVSRTYKGYDGYAPMMAYIGTEGYAINFELREGKQHCQNGTVAFLQETIKLCKKLTDKPLLIRLDSGNDSIDNVAVLILVLELTIIAYNILRMIGRGTIGGRAPRQKRDVKRRRMRTVISNLIMMASHITTHARQLIMGLGKSNIWRHIFADYCENNILATA